MYWILVFLFGFFMFFGFAFWIFRVAPIGVACSPSAEALG